MKLRLASGNGWHALTFYLLLLCFTCGLESGSYAEKERDDQDDYQRHSFIAPFTTFRGSSGQRLISDVWKAGGSASVKENFVRLTPDNPNNIGWVFDQKQLKFQDFSILIRFRISGQGKTMFGDGMGFWVTQSSNRPFSPGELLGHPTSFTGFGIVFDTFRNSARGHIHKDISLVQSSGMTPVAMNIARPSCGIKYRYHEGRDSFSIEDHTLVKILYVNNVVEVKIDRKDDGNWMTCFTANLNKPQKADKVDKLKSNWMQGRKIHFTMTASTGELSDNHDILEFIVSEPNKLDQMLLESEEEKNAPLVDFDTSQEISSSDVADQVVFLAEQVKELKSQISTLDHKLEHKVETIDQNLKEMIAKLRVEEKGAENRIAELEKRTTDAWSKRLEERVSDIDMRTTGTIENRLRVLERRIDRKVEKSKGEAGGWKWPLIFLFLLVLGFMGWNFYSMRKLNRRDKLI